MSDNLIKLDQSLSIADIFSLALGSIIGWGCFVMPGNTFLKTAGPLGTAIGMAFGALIMIIIARSYGYMVTNYPVAGGEFAFAFKGFGRNHAFICAWFLGLSYLSIVPLNATALGLIGRYLFPGILQRGYLYTIADWDVYLGEIIVSIVALICFGMASIKGVKIAGWLQTALTFALVGSVFVLGAIALMHPKVLLDNLSPGFAPGVSPMKGILSIVAIAPWAYVGFDCIPQAAEEFNFSPKKTFKIMTAAIIFGYLMYILVNTITAAVFPWYEFISTQPFWATGVAIEYLMGGVGLLLLGIALIAAIFAGIQGFFIAASRLLFSMARVKALPDWFGYIHPEYKTPSNASIFVLIISLIIPWFGRQVLTWVVDMASIGAAIGYFYTCASAFRLIKNDREHRLLKVNSLIGSLLSLGFLVLLVVPKMPAYLSFPSRIALIIWIAIGIVFYKISSDKYKSLSDVQFRNMMFKHVD